jgi:hypothetical protein
LTKLFTARINATAPLPSIETALRLRKTECEKREANEKARVAWIEYETGVTGAIWVVEKSASGKINLGVSACSACDDRRNEAAAEETEVEIMKADSVAPRLVEEPKTVPTSSMLEKWPRSQ